MNQKPLILNPPSYILNPKPLTGKGVYAGFFALHARGRLVHFGRREGYPPQRPKLYTLNPTPYTLHPCVLMRSVARSSSDTFTEQNASSLRKRSAHLPADLTRMSIHDKHSGSIEITTHMDHISHCKTASVINWWNRSTYREFIINARRD